MSPRTPPGQTRERVYRFVRERLLAGRPPTVREIQRALGFRAVQTAQAHLDRLVAEGRLTKRRGQSRGYALPRRQAPSPTSYVPLLGRVQAGPLREAIEHCDGYLPVESPNPRQDADGLFALRVSGDSMVDAGILPGDIAIVRSQPHAKPGDVVVALVDDEATIKTFHLRRGRVELRPANARYEPLVPDPDSLTILGKVVEIRRSLEPNRSRS